MLPVSSDGVDVVVVSGGGIFGDPPNEVGGEEVLGGTPNAAALPSGKLAGAEGKSKLAGISVLIGRWLSVRQRALLSTNLLDK